MPQAAQLHCTIEWVSSGLVKAPGNQSVAGALAVCAPCLLIWGVLVPGGGGCYPLIALLWVAENSSLVAHLCREILACVIARRCGPCVHLEDIISFSPP